MGTGQQVVQVEGVVELCPQRSCLRRSCHERSRGPPALLKRRSNGRWSRRIGQPEVQPPGAGEVPKIRAATMAVRFLAAVAEGERPPNQRDQMLMPSVLARVVEGEELVFCPVNNWHKKMHAFAVSMERRYRDDKRQTQD